MRFKMVAVRCEARYNKRSLVHKAPMQGVTNYE
jgi:hypothetical protein